MAAYIDSAYVIAQMGSQLTAALWPNAGDLDAAIAVASNYVRGRVRIHCRDGSAELGETSDDVIVHMATYAALAETAAARPTAVWELPPNWETTPFRAALNAIEAGKLQISAEVDPAIAESSSWTDAESYPQMTSRTQLSGLG